VGDLHGVRGPSVRLTRGGRNVRVGCCYAAGAAALLASAPAARPAGALLLWPALALAVVAAGYFGLGPGVYRKARGRLPPGTRLVLAPVLLGQYLSVLYYRRRGNAWDEVAPGLLVGGVLSAAEADEVVRRGVTAVLDLTAEFSESAALLARRYRNLPVLDLTAPTPDQMREAAEFIAEESARGVVYVHCKLGYSRSAAAACAYLLATGQAPCAEEAVARLRRARPSVIVRGEALRALRQLAPAPGSRCPAVQG
jgi:protein-tyrosine phosphatase